MVDLSIVFCMFTRGYPHHPHHPLLRRRRLQRSQASPTKSHLAGMVSSYKGPKNSNGRSERLSVSWRKKEQRINTVILDLIMVIYRQQVFEYMYMIVCIYIYIIYIQINIYLYHLKKISSRGWRCWPGPWRVCSASRALACAWWSRRRGNVWGIWRHRQGRAGMRIIDMYHYSTMEPWKLMVVNSGFCCG